jgi:acyl-CoA:6-aminopenicillanic acid acyl transferase
MLEVMTMAGALEQTTVAGGRAGDFCTFRHLVVRGEQAAIGAALAELAARNHGVAPQADGDPVMTRARRRWREMFYPQLAARARGIAAYFDVDPDDDTVDSSTLGFGFGGAGCSVAWIPSDSTTGRPGLLSRNFDFSTQTLTELLGGLPAPGEVAMAAQPYVIESYPTDAHATLIMCLFDLASGAFDGINDAGLVVALAADDQSDAAEPCFTPQVGLAEHEICRFLLETCATVDDAVEALRLTKQYYVFVPCHYLVADPSGRSFVWEHGVTYNGEHVSWSQETQVITNHLLWCYPTIASLPAQAGNGWTFDRARKLSEALAAPGDLDAEQLKRRHARVRILEADLPVRTLWHNIYNTAARTMEISLHLADAARGEHRTPYFTFGLTTRRTT